MHSLTKWMIYLSLLTSSFDIFGVIQIGGTVRFCQIILLIPYVIVALKCLKKGRFFLPPQIKWLLLWSAFILIFVGNTDHVERSIGYYIWLMLDIANIFLLANYADNVNILRNLLRFYIFSFVFVALFGLFQFFSAPILHFSTPLVAQWWLPGTLPRINGFSYEPSYFATYEIIGWTILLFLIRFDNTSLYRKRTCKLFFLILTLALILSSSRMGILMMIAILIAAYIHNVINLMRNVLRGKLNLRFIEKSLLVGIAICGVSVWFFTHVSFDDYEMFLAGTGVGDTASHSVDQRSLAMERTWNVFLNNPFVGVSLGGVSEAIENEMGIETNENGLGAATFLEVLAASGIIGIIPFIVYFFNLIYKGIRLFVHNKKDGVGLALIFALIAELVILQLNQNILRPYLWMHIAVLSAYIVQFKVNRGKALF